MKLATYVLLPICKAFSVISGCSLLDVLCAALARIGCKWESVHESCLIHLCHCNTLDCIATCCINDVIEFGSNLKPTGLRSVLYVQASAEVMVSKAMVVMTSTENGNQCNSQALDQTLWNFTGGSPTVTPGKKTFFLAPLERFSASRMLALESYVD